MNLTLKVWRQKDRNSPGRFVTASEKRPGGHVFPRNARRGERGIDRARESLRVRLRLRKASAHVLARHQWRAPRRPPRHATCQLHMRHFKDGETITIEPWRARAFRRQGPYGRRAAFDRIIRLADLSPSTPAANPGRNAIPVPKEAAEASMDAAACIGCGACVAACKERLGDAFVAARSLT